MLSMTIQGKNVSVFPCKKPDAPAIYLNTVSGEGLQIYSELQKHPLPDFSRIASVSGSLWFPGIHEYIASHPTKCLPDCVYFSLGDKESKTRNPVLKTVRGNTESIHAYYQGQGIHTIFQLNTGNHYDHAAQRTAKGIAWLLTQ